MANELIYRNLDALAPVQKVLEEAARGLADKSRIISTSGIPEVLGAAVGAGVGGAGSLAALYSAGTVGLSGAGIMSGLATAGGVVGGGAVAGIFVLAAPVALLGVGGYAVLSQRNQRKLKERKELMFQEALKKRDAVAESLKAHNEQNEERTEYLTALNIRLQDIINNLSGDLSGRSI